MIFSKIFLVSLLLTGVSAGEAVAASIIELQPINVSQLIVSIGGNPATVRIDDVSFDGSIAIGRFYDYGKTRVSKVFRYTKSGGMEEIGELANIYIDKLRVSDDGKVIWGARYDLRIGTTSGVFRWTPEKGLQEFGTLGQRGVSVDVSSSNGEFIAGHFSFSLSSTPIYHAYRYSEIGGFEDLGVMQGDSAFAKGISGDGELILGHAQFNNNKASRAFMYSKADGVVDIGTYAANWTSATSISSDRSIIVGSYCFGGFSLLTACTRAPFVYTKKSGIQAMPKIFGYSISGPKISPDGKILAGSYIDSKYESYIYVGYINQD